jgi:hypothetical protein
MIPTIEEAIAYRCIAGYAPLMALIGDRCYPGRLPANEDAESEEDVPAQEFPAIVFSRVSDPDVSSSHDDTGPPELGRPRWQFDVYAETATEALVVADELERAWSNYRGVVADVSIYRAIKADRRIGDAGDLNLHREIIDFFIWHKTPQE